ncbi:MAG: VOC family protein [Candidatus Sericytochromatia bacterium]
MKYLHTMIRVFDLEKALDFFINKLGLIEIRRKDSEKGRFTLIFLATAENEPTIELTYNWDQKEPYTTGRSFGHLAYQVDNIYDTCKKLQENGVIINRPPRDGYMAFIKSPDNISIELLQKGEPLAPSEPWASMPNTGDW